MTTIPAFAAASDPLDFAFSPCGGVRLALGAGEVTLRASGALWIESQAALVVADLHFEKGSAYAARGQMLPPYDTAETLRRLEAEVASLAPRLVVCLGDSFHDRTAGERLAEPHRARIAALAVGRALVWAAGNHDAELPTDLPGDRADEVDLAGLTLRHEPTPGAAPGEVAGHLHPCARVAGRIGSVRRRCFVTDGERLVAPAFGAYAGGLNVLDVAFAGLFARPPIAAALGSARVHPVSWRALRPD